MAYDVKEWGDDAPVLADSWLSGAATVGMHARPLAGRRADRRSGTGVTGKPVRIGDVRAPRRIVTGMRPDGTSCLARVEEVERVDQLYALPRSASAHDGGAQADDTGGYGFYRIWASDRLPIPLPNSGESPFLDLDPAPAETTEVLRRAGVLPPPLGVRVGWTKVSSVPGAASALHWTDSIDLLCMLSGARVEILENGAMIQGAGDLVVQNGTVHAREGWGSEPTVMAYIVVGALGTGPHPPLEQMLAPYHASPVGPVGGHRHGEYRGRPPMDVWEHPPGPAPGAYRRPSGSRPTTIDRSAPRRLVTGTDEAGRSYFARAEEVEEVDYEHAQFSGDESQRIWRYWQIDRLPSLLPSDGKVVPLEPPPSSRSTRVALRRAPLMPAPLGVMVALAEIAPTTRPSGRGWQDTMDAVFVISGEVRHELDGGDTIDLRPGDVLIQNGTNHSWHNTGADPARLFVASFGGARFGDTPPPADRRDGWGL